MRDMKKVVALFKLEISAGFNEKCSTFKENLNQANSNGQFLL